MKLRVILQSDVLQETELWRRGNNAQEPTQKANIRIERSDFICPVDPPFGPAYSVRIPEYSQNTGDEVTSAGPRCGVKMFHK